MKTLVIEPISNTVSPSSGPAVAFRAAPVGDDAPARRLDHADDDPDALPMRVDPLDEDLPDLVIRWHR